MKLSQYIGDSCTYHVAMAWQGQPFTPGVDWNLLFTAKARAIDPDASALIQKITGAGIVATGAIAAVEIVPVDTNELPPSSIVWDIQAENITTGEIRTVAVGSMQLVRDVSRGTSISIPIYTTTPPVLLGPPGKSAYQLAVDNGYSGTVQQWLATLPVSITEQQVADALGFFPIPYPLVRQDSAPGSGEVGFRFYGAGLSVVAGSGGLDGADFAPDGTFENAPYYTNANGFQMLFQDSRWKVRNVAEEVLFQSNVTDSAPWPWMASGWSHNCWIDIDLGTAGKLGQSCIVGEADFYMCVRELPTPKWVKLN